MKIKKQDKIAGGVKENKRNNTYDISNFSSY